MEGGSDIMLLYLAQLKQQQQPNFLLHYSIHSSIDVRGPVSETKTTTPTKTTEPVSGSRSFGAK